MAVMILTVLYSLILAMVLCQPTLACLRTYFTSLPSSEFNPELTKENVNHDAIQSFNFTSHFTIAAFLVLVVAFLFLYMAFIPRNYDSAQHTETKQYFKHNLDTFDVNLLSDNDIHHYLRIEIILVTDNTYADLELEKYDDKVRDRVLSVLSSQQGKDLLTIEGKKAVRVVIAREINAVLSKGKITDVWFRNFLIQDTPFSRNSNDRWSSCSYC